MESAAIDLEVVKAIKAIGSYRDSDHLLKELYDLFVVQAAEVLADLDRDLAAGHWMLLKRHAHRLKGSAGNFGARGVMQLCAEMEGLAEQGEAAAAPLAEANAELKVLVERCLAELARQL